MGLYADIFKHNGQSFSNGGVSETHDMVCVINVPGPFNPDDRHPAVLLVPGNLPNTAKVVPLKEPANQVGPMMGGCYVSTSDSRFSEAVKALTGSYASVAPLHDRYETQAQYDALSI